MSKESFIIFAEWSEAILELDPTDQATILRNLFAYHAGQEIELTTFGVKLVWKLIEPTLSRNASAYERKREVAIENGQRGGRPLGCEIYLTRTGLEIKREDSKLHYLYIVYLKKEGIYKIGETQNLFKRRLSLKVPTDNLEIIHYVEIERSLAVKMERVIIDQNAHNRIKGDYFKFTETDLKSLINLYDSLKYPTNKPTDAKESEKSLYDNVYVNDHVNESDSENVNADNAVQIPPTPEISKGLPEFILPAPGDPSQQIFYETEICMPLHFTIDEATLIHNKWLSVNFGKLFTLKEARINFKGYASSWRFNKGSSPPPPKVVEFTPITPHKYSDQG